MVLIVSLILASVAFLLAEARDLPHSYRFEASNMSFVKEYMTLPTTARSMSPTFDTDPPTEKFAPHSQSGQDMAVLTFLKDKANGYFVDLAANDWSRISNSYVVEYYNNWKGICIEPNPMYLKDLLSNRKCKVFTCAVGIKDGDKVKFRFSQGANGVYGGVVGEDMDNKGNENVDKEVTLVSLTTLLDFAGAPAVMDYLSLDVEGAEYQVVKGLDHTKYTFHIATVERPKPNTHHALARAGYRFLYQTSSFGEIIYLHRSIPNYTELMQQYHQVSDPAWWGSTATYLQHPAWDQEHMEKHEHEHEHEHEHDEREHEHTHHLRH